ncbi:MAG: glycosyltransferase family 4 protein [Acidimicrobiales bacterium]|nr:glycosyltransferase family 4 protein [Acidimicrobiales bacterium]
MRILLHDYSGHPFQVQLSRELAARGHRVDHVHCPSYTTGKGSLERRAGDPDGFRVLEVDLGETFDKYHFGRRWRQEVRYGKLFSGLADELRPDVLVSCNVPLFAQEQIQRWARRTATPFLFWQQDVYSFAMRDTIRRKLPGPGHAAGAWFVHMERRMLRRSDAVVTISPDFLPILRDWGVPADRVHVVENWAPLEDLPERPRANAWSAAHGLDDRRVLLYSGTLGLKHNPDLLRRLAVAVAGEPDVALVVASEGMGADWLAERAEAERLDNLVLLPFQPIDVFPDVLASADVLLAVLEPEAGVFSVPSKVLSYHCAGRPILASVPSANLAARTIAAAGSGLTVEPDDADGFVAAARRLLADPDLRHDLGTSARTYAERAFDVHRIGERFDAILADLSTDHDPREQA